MEGLTLGQIVQALAWIAGGIGTITAIYKAASAVWCKVISSELKTALQPLHEAQAAIQSDLSQVQGDLAQNNLQTARIDLLQAITHTPTEHKAILELAENYFLKLGGNSYMLGKFKEWAAQEKVDVGYILKNISEH